MNSSKYHFIVADDDERARYLTEFVLRRAFPDATLLCFLDGYDALECYLAEGADAIITDHCMPRLCGAELTRAIRQREPDLPIIMVSNSPDARKEGQAAGVDCYLDKGEAMQSLPAMLTALLERRPVSNTLSSSPPPPLFAVPLRTGENTPS